MSNIPKKGATVQQVSGEVGKHSYSIEECEAFCDFINSQLEGDKDLSSQKLVPVTVDTLWPNVGDGVLLWYVLLAHMVGCQLVLIFFCFFSILFSFFDPCVPPVN